MNRFLHTRRRWSDTNRHLGPFTWSPSDYTRFGLMLDSGGDDEKPGGNGGCHLRLYLGRSTLLVELPNLIPDFRIRHEATSWDAATVARLGRDWYEEVFPREFGFTLVDGSLHVHFGPQTHDSETTRSRCFSLPWRQWRFVRRSLYDLEGAHFWTEPQRQHGLASELWQANWDEERRQKDACPKAVFAFADYDGQQIDATTHIEERQWKFGEGWFRWLSWFRRDKVRRSLAIEFGAEVGPEKGSWKGGTTGHGIDMEPGELHEDAFRRYCREDHRAKGRTYQITFLGRV